MTEIKRPYNSRITQIYMKLIREKYPHVNTAEILEYAGIKPYELEDEGCWFSQQQVDLFHERCVFLTGNKDIAREAGQFSAHLSTHSIFRRYFLGLVGPVQAYMMFEKKASFITQSTDFKTEKVNNQKVIVTVTPKEGIKEREYQCKNRMGILESVAITILHNKPQIVHTKCMIKGDEACVYEISWRKNFPMVLKRIRYYYFFVVLVAALALIPFQKPTAWLITALSLFLSSALLTIRSKMQENDLMRKTMKELHLSSDQLLDQIKNHSLQAGLANEVGQAVTVHQDIDSLLTDINDIFREHINFDRGIILLTDEHGEYLRFKVGFGLRERDRKLLKENSFNISNPDSKGIFTNCIRNSKAYLVNDLNDIQEDLSFRSKALGRMIGTKSFICCPISNENEAIGLLAVDNLSTERRLLNSDLNFLKGIATVIGMGIQNIKLIQNTESQFKSIIQVLATSIDARDYVTAGHSEKVTSYALGICDQMNLDDDYKEMIRIAALLHDYGKIAVPDAILKKKGALTPAEYAIIQTHTVKTKEILDKIKFRGIYKQIPEVAYCHHEHMDGRGYPQGLKGEEIPLGARIIAVADFYDALTSERHYRQPMSSDKAIDILLAETNGHLDPKVASAFIKSLNRPPRTVVVKKKKEQDQAEDTFPRTMISGV